MLSAQEGVAIAGEGVILQRHGTRRQHEGQQGRSLEFDCAVVIAADRRVDAGNAIPDISHE
ncbi:MAG: hypothetical protein ABF665_19530 [Gluconacetobacter sp.]